MRSAVVLILSFAGVAPALSAQGSIRHWTELPARLSTARSGHAATELGGKLWVAGGQIKQGAKTTILDTVEVFDPGTGSWSPGPKLPAPRRLLGLVGLGNRLFAIGGEDNNKVYDTVWELVSGKWLVRKSMASARSRFVTAVVGSRIYVFGGYSATNKGMRLCEAYDPATDTWAATASLPGPRFEHAGGVVQGIVYLAGGYATTASTPLRSTWAYDPNQDSWAASVTAEDQIEEHAGGAAVVDKNGELILVGGRGAGDFAVHGRTVERLDLTSGKPRWFAATPLWHPRARMTATVVGGRVYLVGGEIGNGQRVTGVVDRQDVLSVSQSIELKSATMPLPTLLLYETNPTGKLPLLVFGHGLAERPTYYYQLMTQLAALGFLVAAPDMVVLSTPESFGDLMSRTDQALRAHPTWGKLISPADTVYVGFSAGGGGAIVAATKRSARGVVAFAPWAGCVPSTTRCTGNKLIAGVTTLKAPVLLMANAADPLGTSSNAVWIFESLKASERVVGKLVLDGSTHGGLSSGQGFADVGATTDRAGRQLQERCFRYVLSFFETLVFDTPVDPVPVDFASPGDALDTLVGDASRHDPRIKSRTLALEAPDLYVMTDEQPTAGSPLTLVASGPAMSPYVLLISAPRAAGIPVPPFGQLLVDPSALVLHAFAIPADQVTRLVFPVPSSVKGATVHFQGFGRNLRGPVGYTLTDWRRSVRF